MRGRLFRHGSLAIVIPRIGTNCRSRSARSKSKTSQHRQAESANVLEKILASRAWRFPQTILFPERFMRALKSFFPVEAGF
jgi:hypothetical protein